MENKKICFIPHSSPDYLGGMSLFHRNLINHIKDKKMNLDLTWVYYGNENKEYTKDGMNCIEVKHVNFGYFSSFFEKLKLLKILKKNDFDIVNCSLGSWAYFYKKPKKQKIIPTFHGSIYYFNKNHLKRFPLLLRIFLFPYLLISYFNERPSKNTDKLICVSEKVKNQIKHVYKTKKNIFVVRTGVDLKNFKLRNKKNIRKNLKLDENKKYGLYIGRGGYWTKGLDRAINISEKIYKKDKNYRLIVIGPDIKKVKHYIDKGKKFVIFLEKIPREKIPFYYNAVDFFFCLSRYEGGAPTLVVSEAMGSECLVVCSKSSKQEIITDGKNGLIINEFGEKDAEKILNILNNKNKKQKILTEAIKTIKNISLDKWAEKYLNLLLN
jgi:glycosyltransferase involved in cell wall biosynthesis